MAFTVLLGLAVTVPLASTATARQSGKPLRSAGETSLTAASSDRGVTAGTATGLRRQMWVWQRQSPADLVASATRNGVTNLLVWVPPGFSKNPLQTSSLKELRLLAAAAGQQIEALGGDPSWAVTPAAAGAWATEVKRSRLFSRVHLDIEPYDLPGWQTDPAPLTAGMLSAISTVVNKSALPVDADIPFWLNQLTSAGGVPLDEAVMRRVSSVTLMAYRNTSAEVLEVAAPEMATAERLGKKAYIGINLGPYGTGPSYTSYLGVPTAQVLSDIALIDAGGTRWTSFAGMALHDSDHLPL